MEKQPRCQVQVGWTRYAAHAERMDADEAERVFMDNAERHPAALRQLLRVMGFDVDGSQAQYRQVARTLPIVGFFPLS